MIKTLEKLKPDIIVDLDNRKMDFINQELKHALSLTNSEKCLMHQITKVLAENLYCKMLDY